MPKKKSSKAIKRSDVLAKKSEIEDVSIVEMMAKKSLREGPLPTNTELTLKFDVRFDNEAKVLVFEPRLTLIGRYDDSAINDTPVLVSATFQAMYKVPENLGDFSGVELLEFAEEHGIYHVWPYFREFVQSTTKRLGLPSLTIPLFNLELMTAVKNEVVKQTKKKKSAKTKKKKSVRRKSKPGN